MIRVTERSRTAVMSLAQSRAASRLDKATLVASSGQRVNKPSDDPTAYGSMVRRNQALGLIEEHTRSATRAQGALEIAHDRLARAGDLFARAQALAVNGANGTLDGGSRELIAGEVRAIREELVSLANTRYDDKYLFGGTRTDVAPFDPTTGAFLGNDQVLRVPVLDGAPQVASVSGAKAFTAAGGRDVFADLDALVSALEADDPDAIRATLEPLDASREQIVRAQVDASFGADRMRSALDVLATTKVVISEQLSNEIGGDPVAQLSDLTLARSAYERSIAVTKQLLEIATLPR